MPPPVLRGRPHEQFPGREAIILGTADRLVSAANRGIGLALVKDALARGAAHVYAGTRRTLTGFDERVTTLNLDVTDDEQIRNAAATVQSLDLLANNAGIAAYDNLSDRSVLDSHLNVNLFGPYRVALAFLPALTQSRGAIVNVLSSRNDANPFHARRPGPKTGMLRSVF